MADAGASATEVDYVLFTPFEGRAFRQLDHILARLPLGAQYVSVSRIGPAKAAPARS
jgi:hypothetical protein